MNDNITAFLRPRIHNEVEHAADPQSDVLDESSLLTLFVDQVLAQTELDGVSLLDTRGVGVQYNSVPTEYNFNHSSPHPISELVSACPDVLVAVPSYSVILPIIKKHAVSNVFESSSTSGLETYLPLHTRAHLCLTFFHLCQPVFFVIGICRSSSISDMEIQVTRSLGDILLARLVRARQMEYDAPQRVFLASLSHEIRTPLHNTLIGLEMAQRMLRFGDYKITEEMLASTRMSGEALGVTLNALLGFATCVTPRKTTWVELEKVARKAAMAYLSQSAVVAGDSTVTLQCERREVKLDETIFTHIMTQGLIDYLNFSKAGNIAITVICYDGTCSIRITDTEIASEEISLPRSLRPSQDQNPDNRGNGLGLYLTRLLAEEVAGTMKLRSTPGERLAFEVTMPVVLGEKRGETLEILPDVAKISRRKADLSCTVPALHSQRDLLRVLIADDNQICLNLLRNALRRGPTPIDLKEAINGRIAVETFEVFDPHLVITDVSMPEMSGIEAARKMRAIGKARGWKRCSVYTLSGLGSSAQGKDMDGTVAEAEVDGWLTKGLDKIQVIYDIVAETYACATDIGIEEQFQKTKCASS